MVRDGALICTHTKRSTGHRVRFDVELVIDLGDPEDPEDDEVIHLHVDVTTHGPHPILDQDGLDPMLACAFLA